MASLFPLSLPIFAGQGISTINTPQTRQQALLDASGPSGSILLSACYDAFHTELSALTNTDLDTVDINMEDFQGRDKLLILPEQKRYLQNPVISGSTLFLIQSLRYLAFVEATGVSTGSLTPFSDILKRNLEHNLGVVGFSSGILPACVVGTSLSVLAFISKAVEAYRLAIWVGIRTQIYRRHALNATSFDKNTTISWSFVFLGMNKACAKESIMKFNKDLESSSLYITAVMDDTCVTISGHPSILLAFSMRFGNDFVVHKTTLDTLYHAPIHMRGAREQVLADVISRNIQFPTFSDIKVPIRSTFTGDVITKDTTAGSLLELVVDMLLIQPVNWNLVVEKLVESSPRDIPIQLLNMGPGAGLARNVERAFPRGLISSIDLTTTDAKHLQQSRVKQEPIAIVGMAVNMPGAPSVSKLWEVLEQGINTIAEIPEHRFKVSDYNDGRDPGRKMKAHTGNFIDGADEFDNKFFKISPREAKSMDPQQRILLQTAYEALEDSGYVPNSTPTSRPEAFGCYIGVATHDYLQNLRNQIDVYYSTGTLKAFLSGRISYAMQLSGPSIVVDTACSSSNVALYQGARALMNRDCDAAMVGGVNIISSPDMFLGLDRGHFLSPTGQCKAFDASADGYSRSEGCGVFILKRLSDALAEDDRILGVIRGIEVNQSGLAHSITHPHPATQATLFKQVLENSGIEAHRVNVVEAHGTGTQAGDPNELESIRSVFAIRRPPNNPLHITSIKSNLGHLEAASGAAGLAKILLMLQHKVIPKQISLKQLNPRIDPLESDNTIIDVVSTQWASSHEGKPRVALLNNFGAAGSNTALLVEEHSKAPLDPGPVDMHYVFGLSAKDKLPLEELRSKYLHYLQSSDSAQVTLSDIAYTSTARRQIYDHRISVSAANKDDLIEKLTKAPIIQATSKDAQVIFVFSGQGSQYLGMGHSLYQTSSVFKHHVDECHNSLIAAGFPGVYAILTPGSNVNNLSPLEEFEVYQAAIFTLEYSLAKLWMSWGLSPVAVAGHSLGEYAALVIADVIPLKDALMLVANRVRFMVQRCPVNMTGMIAVNSASSVVTTILDNSTSFSDLSIACHNSPIDCVVSGPLFQINAFKEHLDTKVHCKNVLLTVPFGYHSPAMTPILDALTSSAKGTDIRAPAIPIVSNVLGDVVLPGDTSVFNEGYFSRHCSEPVLFDKGIHALMKIPALASVSAWIEVGPHTSTLPMLKANTSVPKGTLFLGSIRKQQDPWFTLTTTLSQLYTLNIPVRWREVFAHLNTKTCVPLPSYPFSKTRFWIPFKEEGQSIEQGKDVMSGSSPVSLVSEYSLLYAWAQRPSEGNDCVAIFETPINMLAGSILGHRVGGMPLCPASVYLEQVFAGIHLASNYLGIKFEGSHAVIRSIEFAKPLVYDEAVNRTILTTITVKGTSGIFSISSRVASSSEEVIHTHGEYQAQSTLHTSAKFTRVLPIITRRMSSVIRPTSEVFSKRTAYEIIFPRVVDYAKEYHTMQSITVDASGMEGCADIRLPSDRNDGKFAIHPVFMDTLLHVAGFVANMQGGINDAFICSQVGSLKVIPHLVNTDSSYRVYCSNAWVPEDEIVVAEVYAIELIEPKRVVAHIKGMAFRRLPLDRFKRGLAHAAGSPSRPSNPPRVKLSTPKTTVTSDPPLVNGIREKIIKIILETCDINATKLDINTDLASLGVDSLMSIEIFGKLENAFPDSRLNAHTLSYCTSTADIIREVSAQSKYPHSDDGGDSAISHSSGISSPRTLVMDDRLSEPTPLAIDEESGIKEVLASVLDISTKDIGEDIDFGSLGLDSLTSIEVLHALKNELELEIPSDFFSKYPTMRLVRKYLSSRLQISPKPIDPIDVYANSNPMKDRTNSNTLTKALRLDAIPICIQDPRNGLTPLFLIHDGSGLVNYYDRLSPLGRPTWGIHNPHFATGEPWESVVQMASCYANYISSCTTEPVILGGWSFGGVAAYEVALQLSGMGIQVLGILLIDAPNPINHVPLSNSLIDSVINLDARSTTSELARIMKGQFAMNARLLSEYNPRMTSGSCPPLVVLRSNEGYNPPGVRDVPSWLADRTNVKSATTGWEILASAPPKVIDIPGHHFEPFHPSKIGEVSQSIINACSYLQHLNL